MVIAPLSATSFNISWRNVSEDDQSVIINGHIICYRQKLHTSAPYSTLGTSNSSVVLSGLNPGTAYIFRVLAYTSEGNGVASNLATKYTLEMCKYNYSFFL